MKRIFVGAGVGLVGAVIVVGIYFFTVLPKKDIQTICEAHKQYLAEKFTGRDEVELAVEHSQFLEAHVFSFAGRNVIAALPKASHGDQRYLLEMAAREVGLQNWSCPEMTVN